MLDSQCATRGGPMPLALSVYFNLVRCGAALIVLMSHAWVTFFPKHHLPWPGHQAVIVFFVLSGYVVAFVADTKETHFAEFALRRAARLLSVTIPALILALIVSAIIRPDWIADAEIILLNVFFLGQNWGLHQAPFVNQPYWSLCYEAWYYAIFAGFYFPKTLPAKLFWGGLAAVVAGPKILLLLPCWLLGAGLYWKRHKLSVSVSAASIMFIVSLAADGAFYWFDTSIAIREHFRQIAPTFIDRINGSNEFVGDFIVATLVAMNFVAITALADVLERIAKATKKAIATMADFTLSLYLFHFSTALLLLHFGVAGSLGVVLTIAFPLALAPFTEFRRPQLLNFFKGCSKQFHRLYWASNDGSARIT